MTAKPKEGFNANSVLLIILIGLSGWTLSTVFDIAKLLAVTVSRVDSNERAIGEIRRTQPSGRIISP